MHFALIAADKVVLPPNQAPCRIRRGPNPRIPALIPQNDPDLHGNTGPLRNLHRKAPSVNPHSNPVLQYATIATYRTQTAHRHPQNIRAANYIPVVHHHQPRAQLPLGPHERD